MIYSNAKILVDIRGFGLYTVLFAALALYSSIAMACDIDGDQVADLTVFSEGEPSLTWTSTLSSGGEKITSAFGDANSLPGPGDYFGTGSDNFGYVDKIIGKWSAVTPLDSFQESSFAFGLPGVVYMPSRDFNGDGITDLAKFLGQCSTLTKGCLKSKATGNFFINSSDGIETFQNDFTTETGLFGRPSSYHFALDANGDGTDDVGWTQHLKKSPKQFRVKVKDLFTGEVVWKRKIGKNFGQPLSIVIDGKQQLVTWKSIKTGTKLFFFDPVTDSKTKHIVPAFLGAQASHPVTADWLGTGSDQVGIQNGTTLAIYNPLDQSLVEQTLPATGRALDCSNNFASSSAFAPANSKNICSVISCK